MSIAMLARPEIRALSPYKAAEQVDDTVRLNANESPVAKSVGDYRRPLNRYPEVRPQQLQRMLANRYGCSTNQLLVTRGSSEAIDLLVRTFCRAGIDSVVIPSPTFSMYRHYAEVQGAIAIEVENAASDDFTIDVDAVLSACNDTSRLIFVCSPNNPTGMSLPRADLLRLLNERSDRSAVVIDEAYIEFSPEDSSIDFLDKYPNLIVLRTLSKALGFAGARCGAVVAAAEIIAMLNAVQAPYALATPVIECVEDALLSDQAEDSATAITEIVAERDRLLSEVSRFSWVQKVWPSDANFFLIRVGNAGVIMRYCENRKILLRHFGGALANCIRITVGSRSENDRLLQVLDTFTET